MKPQTAINKAKKFVIDTDKIDAALEAIQNGLEKMDEESPYFDLIQDLTEKLEALKDASEELDNAVSDLQTEIEEGEDN